MRHRLPPRAHPVGCRKIFELDYELEFFEDLTAIVAQLGTYKPDSIVLCLPDNARTKIVSDLVLISEAAPAIPIVLPSFYGFTNIPEFIDAGASGYAYTKNCTVEELLYFVEQVREGGTVIDGRTASSMFVTNKRPT